MLRTRRQALSLDGTWEFVPDPERRHPPVRLPAGQPIQVPGAWEAQVSDPYGIVHAWYRRRFVVPEDWRHGRLVLHFGSAMAHARVWLDGALVGAHDLGYLPFEIDTGPARPGADHELVVGVENPINLFTEYPAFGSELERAESDPDLGHALASVPRGKQTWYTSTSGLLGSVVAELATDPRFTSLVVLPEPDAARAVVRWRLEGASRRIPATVSLTVTAPSGEVVSRTTADARAASAFVPVPDAATWDIGHPNLYRLDARLSMNGGPPSAADVPPEDEASVRFGMRSVSVRAGEVLLNGRPIYLRGALDQDFWPEGRSNPPTRAALERQVALAQDMGLNLLRCHIKIPDSRYLDVADEAGILTWCELPSWSRFDTGTGDTARRMLDQMVEEMGSHPSLIAWTVINEGWGVDLAHEASDRRWLRTTVDALKRLDPTRLVVDNSPCETPDGPGYHLRTDLVDFHIYRSAPDRLPEWRAVIDDFARRPPWLWSSHGDASVTGDEALVLSEFGGWGLPTLPGVGTWKGLTPWWWDTGETFCRPAGMLERFHEHGLGRIWSDFDSLAVATQWRQLEGLTAQIREVRRHGSIKGYVVTELSDAFWEANGLLTVDRRPKAYQDRLAELNAADALVIELPRADLWGGEQLICDALLSSFSSPPAKGGDGRLDWQVRLADGQTAEGSTGARRWPRFGAAPIGRIAIVVPNVDEVTSGELFVRATRARTDDQAIYRQGVVVVPASLRMSANPRRVSVVDPLDLWSIETRVMALGHEVAPEAEADVIVTSELDRRLVDSVERGRRLLFLARSSDAVAADVRLARPMRVMPRRSNAAGPAQALQWDGDWVGVFAWALPGAVAGLADGGLLGDAHREVFPDLVLDGLVVGAPNDGVEVGLFTGWIHSPAALLATFEQGAGWVTATTLKVAPEGGPIATVLLESLIQRA